MEPIKRIGKYDVLEMIGRGGMGIVFKAADPLLNRLVAIKIMTGGFADDPDLLKRFYREAQSTASLTHPNIVTVYDMGDQDGAPYLVMQFLEGENLHSIIKSRRNLSLLTKTNYLLQVCRGLQYAHERKITHRDVKPANIMVLPDGTVKIVDFGIARIGNDRPTRSGQILGSIHYMSPEQINEREVDARSDIFALGTVAYELLTFTLPFQGQDVPSILLKILHDSHPPLSDHLKDYPAKFDAILERALAKRKEDRYQTVEELTIDLAQVELLLREEMITKLHCDAERLISEGDFGHAREQLQHLMRLDPQNLSASQRVREVEREIQKQRLGEEVRQLRVQAEQLIAQQDFDTAQRLLEQALALTPEEHELHALRESLDGKKARHNLIRNGMEDVRAARKAGDLDGALSSLERLLAVQPEAPDACRLKDALLLEVVERDKQRKLQLLIAEARRQISSRKFSDALDTLKRVEVLDENAPRLRELLRLATEGAEQELRRRTVEKVSSEISDALDRDDPSHACTLAEAALERFPGERGLSKLKTLAEQQIETRGRNLWLVEQMTLARRLLESSKSEDALGVLEAACQKYPGEGDLESLISIARAAIQQDQAQRRRAEYTLIARDALRSKDYAEAIKVLEAAKSETKSNYFDDLLQFAKEESVHFELEKKVDGAVAQAQQLIDSGDYDQAVQFLESALEELPDEDLRILLASARRQLADYRHGLDDLITTANQLLAQGLAADSITCLEAQRATYNREPTFQAACAEASQQQQRISEAVAPIRAELAAGEFDAAYRQLRDLRHELGDIGEVQRLEGELQALRARTSQKELGAVLRETEDLVRSGVDAEVEKTNEQPMERQAAPETVQAAPVSLGKENSVPQSGAVQGTTIGDSCPSPAARRAQQAREKSVLELTPPGGIVQRRPASKSSDGGNAPPPNIADSGPPVTQGGETRTGSAPSEDVSEWRNDTLRAVEKQLAIYLGSLARILVKKAASRTTDVEELYSILAASLERKADREAFLARKVEVSKDMRPSPRRLHDATSVAPQSAGTSVELTPAAIDHAVHVLARYMGPIAGVLVKRATPRADSLRALYLLLAEHLENKTERSRFLREAGFTDSSAA